MFNYLLTIEYEGTNFVGWQSQKNGKSIQDSIEKALKKVLEQKLELQVLEELIKESMLILKLQILN